MPVMEFRHHEIVNSKIVKVQVGIAMNFSKWLGLSPKYEKINSAVWFSPNIRHYP